MDTTHHRLARVVQELLGGSHARAKHEIEVGHVLINGAVVCDPGAWVAAPDRVEHRPDLPRRHRPSATPPLEVFHADDAILVINKPAGLLVHPTVDGEQDTVISRAAAVVERLTGRHSRVLVVHRLDRDTSGVMVLALAHAAAQHLQRQFRAHTVERRYHALVRGEVTEETRVERAIARPRPGARRAALAPGRRGAYAVTMLRPVEQFAGATLVEAELGTGKTHQVRVHLAYLGHPVLGDTVYGAPREDPVAVGRLALHAAVLGLVHPSSGEKLRFTAPLPEDIAGALRRLRARRRSAQRLVHPITSGRREPERTAGATRRPLRRTPRQRGS